MRELGRKKKRSILKPLILFGCLISAAWSAGFLAFSAEIPRHIANPTQKTDGIVVLTGGTERLNTAISLLSDQHAEKLLISGVYRGVDLQQLLDLFKQAPQELECCIDVGHEAVDTRSNAKEAANWVEKTGFSTLRLVTANYHMPRSLLEFRHALPGITLIDHPVFPDHVKVDEWWLWPGTASLLIGEYNKFLLVWARQFLSRHIPLEFLK